MLKDMLVIVLWSPMTFNLCVTSKVICYYFTWDFLTSQFSHIFVSYAWYFHCYQHIVNDAVPSR